MPNPGLIIAILTAICSCIGLLLAVNLSSRKMRVMGRGMLAGAGAGGLYLGLVYEWFIAGVVLGFGLAVALVLIYFFVDSWGFF